MNVRRGKTNVQKRGNSKAVATPFLRCKVPAITNEM